MKLPAVLAMAGLVLVAPPSGIAGNAAVEVETAIAKPLPPTHVVTHRDPDTALPPERLAREQEKRSID